MCLEEPAERHLAGSPPSSGFGCILPSPAGLGRPKCTDGHLAGTLGHGPVLTHNLLLPPPSSASVVLSILQSSDWARTGRWWWVVGRGLRHRDDPGESSPTLDQTLIEENLCLCCSAPEAWEENAGSPDAAPSGKIPLM